MENIRPFSPDDALKNKPIPDKMITAVNELLSERFNNKPCEIEKDDIIDRFLLLADNKYTRDDVFNNNWLDFEPIYREVGWSVNYIKPAYFETKDSYFAFERNK